MADEKEIVYGVRIDATDLKSQGDAISKQIQQLRSEQLNLNVTTAEGSKAYKDNAAQLKLLESQQKLNQKQLGALTEEEKKNTDQTNFNNNSIKQNRELLKELNAEYIRLQKPTAEQTARIKTLNDTLKKQEEAIGNTSRNVGNYKAAFGEALNGINLFGKGLNDITKLILTNPIGLLVTGVTALLGVLRQFEPVFDFFERGLAAINAGFKALIAGENIIEAANQAYALAGAIQDLEDAQRANNIQTALAEAQIKNLILQSKNRENTEKERLAFLDQAGKLEQENFDRQLRIAQEQQRIANEELERAEKNGQATDEIRDRAAQAQINLINLESSSADLQERISTRRNALLEADLANQKRATEEYKKLRAEEAEAHNQLLIKEFEVSEQLKAIRQGIADQEEIERTNVIIRRQEESQALADARMQEYELFLQNQVDTAQTAEEYKNKRIDQINEESRIKLQNTKLTEEQRKKIIIETNKALTEVNKQYVQATIAGYDAIANTLAGLATIAGEQTEIGKVLAVVSTTISTYTAAQKAYESTIGIPFVGPVLAPINAAIAIVQGLLRVQQIQSVKVPKFADGGFTGSGFGLPDSTGYRPAGIVHENEYVVPKPLVTSFAPEIARIERARVSGLRGYANGGFVTEQISSQTITMSGMIEAIKQLQLVVSVQEITDVQNNLRAIETSTSLT